MTDLTLGQRIAEGRKRLNLSQEALGEKMGVSRQAISKWESDGAVPEIDKLISLSKLFGVSVGWLLGIEETAASEEQPEISEELLHKIEQIIRQYQPKERRLSLWQKALAAALAVTVLILAGSFIREWSIALSQMDYLSAQTVENANQNANILHRLANLEDRISNLSVLPEAAVSEAIVSAYDIRTQPDLEKDCALVSVSVIPATWSQDITASVSVRKDGTQLTSQVCAWDGSAWVAKINLPIDDGYSYWLVLEHADGTKEQTDLADSDAQNLATTYTIGCRITCGTASFDLLRNEMTLSGYIFRITNPTVNQQYWSDSIPWERAELVLVHIRGHQRTSVDTYSFFTPDEANETATDGQSAWSSMECYPKGPFALPDLKDGDGLELWVYLEMGGGISNNRLVTSWSYTGGEFIGSEPTAETVPPQ